MRLLKVKNLVCIALVIVLCLSVVACNDGNSSQSTKDSAKPISTADSVKETEVSQLAPTKSEKETQAQKVEVITDSKQSDPNDIYDATGFVSISDVIPDVILEIRYYSTYNFIGDRINGYEQPVALITKEAASGLKKAADELRKKGYRLKIFDAYRPQMAVDHFALWAADTSDVRMKQYFYPDVDKANLFCSGYIAYYSGHSRGCTVDLTLFDMKTGKEVDMGGPYDYFSQLSHPSYTNITEEQYNNRMLLRQAMVNNGFRPCQTEWWDFSYINEPYPNTYFNFSVSLESLDRKEGQK